MRQAFLYDSSGVDRSRFVLLLPPPHVPPPSSHPPSAYSYLYPASTSPALHYRLITSTFGSFLCKLFFLTRALIIVDGHLSRLLPVFEYYYYLLVLLLIVNFLTPHVLLPSTSTFTSNFPFHPSHPSSSSSSSYIQSIVFFFIPPFSCSVFSLSDSIIVNLCAII